MHEAPTLCSNGIWSPQSSFHAWPHRGPACPCQDAPPLVPADPIIMPHGWCFSHLLASSPH